MQATKWTQARELYIKHHSSYIQKISQIGFYDIYSSCSVYMYIIVPYAFNGADNSVFLGYLFTQQQIYGNALDMFI